MFEDHNVTIAEILQNSGRLTEADLEGLVEESHRTGKALADVVSDADFLSREEVLQSVADYLQYEYIAEPPASIPKDILEALDAATARLYAVVPLRADTGSVDLLARDPFNSQIIDDLTFSLNKDTRLVVCDPEVVDGLILAAYGEEEASLEEILAEIDAPALEAESDDLTNSDIAAMASEAPIIRFVNLILTQAIKDKASDIHFEPFEDQFRIRYRIDGALYEMAPPPRSLALPVISRIKVLSDLNIAERRIPQDGRIKITISGRPVDLRVSTLPTQFGESVVLRVLDKSIVNLDLEVLDMPDDVLSGVRAISRRPNGIFIVTGPTGSGKTTTLYSTLREVNQPEVKILSAEDPVEYEIEGIMQVSVNHQIGFTFASALRSFLRQDPDKIMVGEIRDLETAQIAVQASLTGHLVMSTLHTNDAAGAVIRLIDMGLEPYLIAASLEAVLAQRLVRRTCSRCRLAYEPRRELLDPLGLAASEVAGRRFFYGRGCPRCNQTGYLGRAGLFELMLVTDLLREQITTRAPAVALRRTAREQGMRTLREDGIRRIFEGGTTIEEVLKYA